MWTTTSTSSNGATVRISVSLPNLDAMLLRKLGLSIGASKEEVKARWRALVKQAHPDHGGDPGRFRELTELRQGLKDAGLM